MTTNTLLRVEPGKLPQAVDGQALDSNSLHDWLALPVQHFIDRHPEKSRQQLINEVTEVVAELIGSSTSEWRDALRMTDRAKRHLEEQVGRKWRTFVQLRANGGL